MRPPPRRLANILFAAATTDEALDVIDGVFNATVGGAALALPDGMLLRVGGVDGAIRLAGEVAA